MRWPETEREWGIAVIACCLGVVNGVAFMLLVDLLM